jgi:uncharacterized coiled-coil protein SlyX
MADDTNMAGSPDGGNGNNTPDGGQAGSDDNSQVSAREAELTGELASLRAKLDERNTLLTGAQQEIAKARNDAKGFREKLKAAENQSAGQASDEAAIEKRIKSFNEEWEQKHNPVVETNKKYLSIITDEKISGAIHRIATKLGAVQPELIAEVLSRKCALNTETLMPYVVDEKDGGAALDRGVEMTIEGFVTKFLSLPENANLVSSTAKLGSGGRETTAQGAGSFTKEQINNMSPDEYKANREKIRAARRR